MKRLMSPLCWLVLVALPAQAEDPALLGLAWLSGCWEAEQRERDNGETWMQPDAAGSWRG